MTQTIKVEIKDFIGVFENAYSTEYCEEAIKAFDELDSIGFTLSRKQHEDVDNLYKNDKALYPGSCIPMEHCTKKVHQDFLQIFWRDLYPAYAERFSELTHASDPHTIYTNKMQKTEIGQGYHVWHYESSTRGNSTRLLSWILYLNDVEEGGETEFLHLHRRVKPKTGTFVLFPAAFTHTHRGNPPLSNTKYIATGWVEF